MMGFVIQRTDQGGGYVTPAGSEKAYTKKLERARVYGTRSEAQRHLCPGNERVLSLAEVFEVTR